MCLDYPEKLSIVLPCTLANNYPPEAAIRGDEGTLTLQNPGEWNAGFDSVTVVPMKGEPRVFPAGKIDPGESTFDCARRELAEETGYRAREWARAGVLHNAGFALAPRLARSSWSG